MAGRKKHKAPAKDVAAVLPADHHTPPAPASEAATPAVAVSSQVKPKQGEASKKRTAPKLASEAVRPAGMGREQPQDPATIMAEAVQSVLHPSQEGRSAGRRQPAPRPKRSDSAPKPHVPSKTGAGTAQPAATPRRQIAASAPSTAEVRGPAPDAPRTEPDPASLANALPVASRQDPESRQADPLPEPPPQPEGVDAAAYASRADNRNDQVPGPEPRATASAKAEEPAEAGQPDRPGFPHPDFDALAENMGELVAKSREAAEAFLKAREDQPAPASFGADVTSAFKALGQVAEHWLVEPQRLIEAQAAISSQFMNLWAGSLQRLAARPLEPTGQTSESDSKDKRFADPEWRDNPFFDFVRRAYLLGTDWANQMVEGAESLDRPTREKARFYMRQISSALSPSNFVATNPELLRETLQQNGSNLVRGMTKLAEDIAAGGGDLKIRQTDSSKFALGVNMALTPGKVVFRNDLIELLQYAPSTPTVFKRPLLIVPPWINKFYVLDLNPEKSFIRWAVAQGLTVFVVSWVNPDERHADKGFGAYMQEGIFAALDAIETATGETDIATIGYCVGGTLLAVALAYMAAQADRRISSATLFTTQVDFTHAGDLKVFADEAQIRAVEAEMSQSGYLKGSKMAQAFNMLRPDDLIWSYVVNNYLKGKDPLPFDLLAWNSDSTRMPAANHSFYLRNCYLENKLTRGEMEIEGVRLDLGKVTIPIYNLATREDHIAPALSVFEGSRSFGGPVRYVLAGSGHIAGVVSPPAKAKYGYWDGPDPKGSYADWLDKAEQHPGSWWPDWFAWLAAQAPDRVPARVPGGGHLEILGDAPGTYVLAHS